MAQRPASVGILEDDDNLRQYLADIVEATRAYRLAFAEPMLSQAVKSFDKTDADICLVDLELPDGSGFDFTQYVKEKSGAKVLILTVLGDRESVLTALRAGADGYLLKDTPPEQIVRDVECVLSGDTPISPQAATHLLHALTTAAPGSKEPVGAEVLTEREQETLRLFERGLSYEETARALGISHNTVRTHVKAIYAKLNVNSKNEAIFEARQMGWLRR